MFHHISRKDDSVFEKRYIRRYPLLLAMRCSDECTVCYTPEELAKKRSQSCPSLPEIGKELPKKIKKDRSPWKKNWILLIPGLSGK